MMLSTATRVLRSQGPPPTVTPLAQRRRRSSLAGRRGSVSANSAANSATNSAVTFDTAVTPQTNNDAIAAAQTGPTEMEGGNGDDDLYADLEQTARKYSTKTNPYAGHVDVTSKQGAYTFKEAGRLPTGYTERLEPGFAQKEKFWDVCNAKIQEFNLSVLYVPIQGDGTLKDPDDAVLTPHNVSNLSEYYNIFDRPNFKLVTLARAKAYSSWYNGGEDQTMDPRPNDGSRMVREYIDPNKDGLVGEQNLEKIQLRISAEMAFKFLASVLTPTAYKMLLVREKEFTYEDPVERRRVSDGLIALHIVLEQCSPHVMVSSKEHEDQLRSLTVKGVNDNVVKFNAQMEKHRQMMVIEGRPCGEEFFGEQLLRGLAVTGSVNPLFGTAVQRLTLDWFAGDKGVTSVQIMSDTNNVYTNCIFGKNWKVAPAKSIVLATQAQQLLQRNKLVERALTSIMEGASIRRNNNDDNAWMFTKRADTMKHPKTGVDMVWCDVGHKGGCYMKAPHDHAQWELAREKKGKFRRSKKAKVAATTTTNIKDGDKKPAAKKSGALKLDGTISQAALTTNLQSKGLTNAEIEEILWELDGQTLPKE